MAPAQKETLMDGDTIARLAYLGLILAALGGWVLVEYRGRMGFALRSALAWVMIFVAAIAGYGIWSDVKSDLTQSAVIGDGGRIEIPRAADGHFYMTLDINGTPIRFLADTGATSMVLTQADAAKLGIDPAGLDYDGEALTANGAVRTASIRLPRVAFGPHLDEDFPAYVNEGDLDGSLLGMEYLQAFRVELDGNKMTLNRRLD
jgi:aspartyl protease family protein